MKAFAIPVFLACALAALSSCNEDEVERYKRLAKQQEMIADLNARKAMEYEQVARMEIDACYQQAEHLRQKVADLEEALAKSLEVQKEMAGGKTKKK